MKSVDIKTIQNRSTGTYLKEKDTFRFSCHNDLSCFNYCCRNLNLFLYPYDVLRLSKSLNITSSTFIKKHTDLVMREGNYFPDVLLHMDNKKQMTCPFLSETGCSVYNSRPYSCRSFPIEQGIIENSNIKSTEIMNFFKPPVFCMGQHESIKWTVEEWSQNQQSETYSKMTIQWANIKQLFHINPWPKAGNNNNAKAKMTFMAAYNIDSFRDFIFKSSFLSRYKITNKTLNKIRCNEIELLKLGFHWIKLFVWGIRSNIIINR